MEKSRIECTKKELLEYITENNTKIEQLCRQAEKEIVKNSPVYDNYLCAKTGKLTLTGDVFNSIGVMDILKRINVLVRKNYFTYFSYISDFDTYSCMHSATDIYRDIKSKLKSFNTFEKDGTVTNYKVATLRIMGWPYEPYPRYIIGAVRGAYGNALDNYYCAYCYDPEYAIAINVLNGTFKVTKAEYNSLLGAFMLKYDRLTSMTPVEYREIKISQMLLFDGERETYEGDFEEFLTKIRQSGNEGRKGK